MNERRALSRQHGYGVVLALVLASAAFQVAAPLDSDWARLVSIGLGAATLVAAVWAARPRRRVAWAAAAATVLLALFALVVLVVEGEVPDATAGVVNGLLIAFAPAVIGLGMVRDIRAEGAVTVRTLSGVLSIYLLLGMFFALLGAVAAAIGDGPYFAEEPDPTRSDLLYFSYVTLSTTGFGDLSPVTDVGRMFAVTEALIGQIYLVTVVAMIVANLRPRGVRA
jgi:Ion channel